MSAAHLLVRVLLAALVVVVMTAAPAPAAPPTRYALTAAQERVVLRLVDDFCGDTWCEGDHAFRFRSLSCHPRRGCVLRVELSPWSEEPRQWYARSARVLGFARFSDMVVTSASGERSLQPTFSEAVGRAVRSMTASVPEAVSPTCQPPCASP